jgi:hypothetical protein
MTNEQAIQAFKVFAIGSALGAFFGGVAGFRIGAAISGAVAVEMVDPGKGIEFFCKTLGIAPPVEQDETVYDAIPVFDDEPSPLRKMLLLGEGVRDGK